MASLPPYLTDEEIEFITRPRTQGAARRRYFREVLQVRTEARPNGQPLVWRSDFEAKRRHEQDAANDGQRPSRDWSAFEKRVRYAGGEKTEGREPARA